MIIAISPQTGKTGCAGATEHVGSDRYPWFVNSYAPDGKTVVIERPQVRGINVKAEWPDHRHEFTRKENPETITLVFRYGSWFIKANDKEKARLIAARAYGYKGTVEWAGKMDISFNGMFKYTDPSF